MFTWQYWIWLAYCTVLISVLSIFSIKKKWKLRTCINIMVVVSIVSEVMKILSHIWEVSGVDGDWSKGGYLRAVALPFHLCSVLIFVFFYMGITKDEKKIEFCKKLFFPIGFFGGVLAILMATSGVDFNDPVTYQTFSYHAFILWFAIYLIGTKQISFNLIDYKNTMLCYLAYVVLCIWINGVFINTGVDSSNFLFLVEPPMKGLPLLNLNHGYYAYLFHLLFVGIVLVSLVELPFIIINYKKEKNLRES